MGCKGCMGHMYGVRAAAERREERGGEGQMWRQAEAGVSMYAVEAGEAGKAVEAGKGRGAVGAGEGRAGEGGGRYYRAASRARDVLVAGVGLLVLLPVLGVIALLIVVESPGAGPVFVQERVGRGGKRFKLYKFRSMVPGAQAQLEVLKAGGLNEMDGPVFKMREDPRVTRIGKVLRRSGLDELLQLWNVLKGEMSLVGPRPAVPEEVAEYGEYEMGRLRVEAGITCIWQVQRKRNEVSFGEWMAMDMEYIERQSMRLDMEIMAATVRAMIGMEGR